MLRIDKAKPVKAKPTRVDPILPPLEPKATYHSKGHQAPENLKAKNTPCRKDPCPRLQNEDGDRQDNHRI